MSESDDELTSVSGESEWTVGYTTIFLGRKGSKKKKGEKKKKSRERNKMNISKVIRVCEQQHICRREFKGKFTK